MTNPGGDFFLEFSIRDTVGKNRYFCAHMQENRMAGVCGISGGGGGFSRGSSSISRGADGISDGQGGGVGALRSRQESMGFNFVEAGGKEFDQAASSILFARMWTSKSRATTCKSRQRTQILSARPGSASTTQSPASRGASTFLAGSRWIIDTTSL